jgi:hypothetical protein
MNQLDSVAEILTQHKRVTFSFFTEEGTALVVAVRECEPYDFDEYGEEFVPGEMFEIGPARPMYEVMPTTLVYANISEAGNAVLRHRAELLGLPWGESSEPNNSFNPDALKRAG